jgi:very-short-patch-repair endonuclease
VSSATSNSDILGRIQSTRKDLLDLSVRNRLISTPRESSRARKIEIVDESAEEVFRILVREHKAMSFLPGKDEIEEADSADRQLARPQLEQPEDETTSTGELQPHHIDRRLQTRLISQRLQDRLLHIYYDAETYEQEQGVSILYLALGFLKWYEAPSSDKARYAPLLLIPVTLERASAASRFYLKYRDEEVTTNLSLQAKLHAELGVELPDVPDMEDITPSAYYDAVRNAIEGQARWEVRRDDIVLWFFSFAKYLMFRDLDPASWPESAPLAINPTLTSLLGPDGFRSEPPLCGDSEMIDPIIPPVEQVHVTDADSSQAIVIEEVRRGRNLVIQGPPGTGKSQTITNLIASAVHQGKTVLFVAEKMAALNVVHSRLESLGLGALCLELHSQKANKRMVLEEIARTLALGRPKHNTSQEQVEALEWAIARLNAHAAVMNNPLQPAGVTPYQMLGRLSRLYGTGIDPTSLSLPGAESWPRSQYMELRQGITDLQTYLVGIGPPTDHPWRGVNRTEHILPADRNALESKIASAVQSQSAVQEACYKLTQAFGLPPQSEAALQDMQRIAQLGLRIVRAPALDRSAIAHPVWKTRRTELVAIVQEGRAFAEGMAQLSETVAPVAWETDLAGVRRILAAHGGSLLRFFRKDYREAVATLRGILKSEPPKSPTKRLALVDQVIQVQTLSRRLERDPSLSQCGRDAFGSFWNGSRSDWIALEAILEWEIENQKAGLPWNVREVLTRLEQPEAYQLNVNTIRDHLKLALAQLQDLVKALDLSVPETFGAESLYSVPVARILERLRLWQEHPEALTKWIGYQTRRRRLEKAGLAPIVSGLHDGQITREVAAELFDVAYYQALVRSVFLQCPELAEFDGGSHERLIDEFRMLDHARIQMARAEVANVHYDRIPRNSTSGEMAVIRREIEKKRRHKPIRQLVKDAGTALQAIKPVFMMSPLSVAQFLEPGALSFDVLLVDEASQVSPVDALGAIARVRQVVVVGDDKQLPPTRFFAKMLDDSQLSDEDSDLNAGDLESVLGLCVAQGVPQRMLRWHYRSRHHSLIAVSNREFYQNNLCIVPSPTAVTAMHGLHFRHIKDGVFDRGKTASNAVEARAIAQAVIEHAKRYPKKSLGVGAFSVSQRDMIRDELELLLRLHVELADFFSTGQTEPFFVKNLENIQGDERDVIFISVGYGRDASRYMTMNFGPLSTQGGERRLNVLISRARERCEVFSSITADDIDLERGRSRGTAAFKTFLRYAAAGILDHQAPTGGGCDSDLERQVDEELARLGYEVHRQVGAAGFIIDLAVVDSTRPGQYLLGIECDGATYHSSRSARDRDRLREAVLKDRGWRLHQIWSTDWFQRPREQLCKLVEAIQKAKTEADGDEEGELEAADHAAAEVDLEREEPDEALTGETAPWVVPYVEAQFEVPRATAIHETPLTELAKIVVRVVETEGPIHRDEIARRITCLWGLQRTGVRIVETIGRAIDSGLPAGILKVHAGFVSRAGLAEVPVRDRSQVASANLKKPEMIAPIEIRQAILHLVADHVGLRHEEATVLVARALGFKATSPKLRDVIEKTLRGMTQQGAVALRDGKLFPATASEIREG